MFLTLEHFKKDYDASLNICGCSTGTTNSQLGFSVVVAAVAATLACEPVATTPDFKTKIAQFATVNT